MGNRRGNKIIIAASDRTKSRKRFMKCLYIAIHLVRWGDWATGRLGDSATGRGSDWATLFQIVQLDGLLLIFTIMDKIWSYLSYSTEWSVLSI